MDNGTFKRLWNSAQTQGAATTMITLSHKGDTPPTREAIIQRAVSMRQKGFKIVKHVDPQATFAEKWNATPIAPAVPHPEDLIIERINKLANERNGLRGNQSAGVCLRVIQITSEINGLGFALSKVQDHHNS